MSLAGKTDVAVSRKRNLGVKKRVDVCPFSSFFLTFLMLQKLMSFDALRIGKNSFRVH
jgi:hypothetical protein